jgi:hypothetical protein
VSDDVDGVLSIARMVTEGGHDPATR